MKNIFLVGLAFAGGVATHSGFPYVKAYLQPKSSS
jgi:hypothetical protein